MICAKKCQCDCAKKCAWVCAHVVCARIFLRKKKGKKYFLPCARFLLRTHAKCMHRPALLVGGRCPATKRRKGGVSSRGVDAKAKQDQKLRRYAEDSLRPAARQHARCARWAAALLHQESAAGGVEGARARPGRAVPVLTLYYGRTAGCAACIGCTFIHIHTCFASAFKGPATC